MAKVQLNINSELYDFLPKPTVEDDARLEYQLKTDGVIRDPIVYWKETNAIIDGHRRFRLGTALGLIDTATLTPMSFKDIEDVKMWMTMNQLAKRNLTDEQRLILIGSKYNLEKKLRGGKQDQNQSEPLANGESKVLESTAAKIARETNVSPATVKRAAKFERETRKDPVRRAAIMAGKNTKKPRKPRSGTEKFSAAVLNKIVADGLKYLDRVARAFGNVKITGTIKENPEHTGLIREITSWKKHFYDWVASMEKAQAQAAKAELSSGKK